MAATAPIPSDSLRDNIELLSSWRTLKLFAILYRQKKKRESWNVDSPRVTLYWRKPAGESKSSQNGHVVVTRNKHNSSRYSPHSTYYRPDSELGPLELSNYSYYNSTDSMWYFNITLCNIMQSNAIWCKVVCDDNGFSAFNCFTNWCDIIYLGNKKKE